MIGYALACGIILNIFARLLRTERSKRVAKRIIILAFVLSPFIDSIYSYSYYKQYVSSHGGAKVFRTAEDVDRIFVATGVPYSFFDLDLYNAVEVNIGFPHEYTKGTLTTGLKPTRIQEFKAKYKVQYSNSNRLTYIRTKDIVITDNNNDILATFRTVDWMGGRAMQLIAVGGTDSVTWSQFPDESHSDVIQFIQSVLKPIQSKKP